MHFSALLHSNLAVNKATKEAAWLFTCYSNPP